MNGAISTSTVIETATDSGASGAFVAVLATDAPDGRRHWPRHQMRRAMRDARSDPVARTRGAVAQWGHFLTALWDGDTGAAWARADGDNRALMRRAGVAPNDREARATDATDGRTDVADPDNPRKRARGRTGH